MFTYLFMFTMTNTVTKW